MKFRLPLKQNYTQEGQQINSIISIFFPCIFHVIQLRKKTILENCSKMELFCNIENMTCVDPSTANHKIAVCFSLDEFSSPETFTLRKIYLTIGVIDIIRVSFRPLFHFFNAPL